MTLSRSILSYSLSGVDGVAYVVRVRTADGAGNTGPWSSPQEVVFDRTPPSLPADVAGSVSGSTVTFSWTPSTDAASGVWGYVVTVGTAPGSADIAYRELVTSPAYSFVGEPGRTYYLTTTAVDTAGNEGPTAASPGVQVAQATRTPGFDALVSIGAIAAGGRVAAIRVGRRR